MLLRHNRGVIVELGDGWSMIVVELRNGIVMHWLTWREWSSLVIAGDA